MLFFMYLFCSGNRNDIHGADRCISLPFSVHPSPSLETCNPLFDTYHMKITDFMMIQWNLGDQKQLI